MNKKKTTIKTNQNNHNSTGEKTSASVDKLELPIKNNMLALLFFFVVPVQIILHELAHFLSHLLMGGSATMRLTQTLYLSALTETQTLLVTILGPALNIIVALIGVCILYKTKHVVWGALLSAFVIRNVVMMVQVLFGAPSSDEIKIGLALHISPVGLALLSGLLGVIILHYAIKKFPNKIAWISAAIGGICWFTIVYVV